MGGKVAAVIVAGTTSLLPAQPQSASWDLTTGPATGDLLDLAAFSDKWLEKKK